MTKEEAVEILQGAIKKPNTKDGYLGQAIDMAIKALEQESRWIPVSERLPEKSGAYLVSIVNSKRNYEYITVSDFEFSKGEWFNVEHGEDVVAWFPLPKPYVESEDKE